MFATPWRTIAWAGALFKAPASWSRLVVILLSVMGSWGQAGELTERLSYAEVVSSVQPKMVKVFGTGGLRGLESYQSGFLVSASGHVLTAWSYVLDSGDATVVLNDGRKFTSEILAVAPALELAVIKIDAEDLPHFAVQGSATLRTGARVLAFSNLYGVAKTAKNTMAK